MDGQLFRQGMGRREFQGCPQGGENIARGYGWREPSRWKPETENLHHCCQAAWVKFSTRAGAHKVLQSSRQVWPSNSQAFELLRWSRVSLPSKHQAGKIHLQQNLFKRAFSDAEIAPRENAFPPLPPARVVYGLPEVPEDNLANIFLVSTDPFSQA